MDQIIQKVVAGDRQAYAKVVEEYQGVVWSILSVLLYDRPTTEKLAQRVFIDAYLRLDKFDLAKGRFKDFLRTIARYHVREQLKAATEANGRLEIYREHLARHFADDTRAASYQKQVAQMFKQCSANIAPRAAEILQMRYHQSKEFAAISKATNRPIASVRQQLHRAFAALAGRMIQMGGPS